MAANSINFSRINGGICICNPRQGTKRKKNVAEGVRKNLEESKREEEREREEGSRYN